MITQSYLARHFQGRSGMRDPALVDVAQDYALKYLHDQGAFELGIVLKGGTSLRKLRAGNAGRFSTDLDFATPDLGSSPRSTRTSSTSPCATPATGTGSPNWCSLLQATADRSPVPEHAGAKRETGGRRRVGGRLKEDGRPSPPVPTTVPSMKR